MRKIDPFHYGRIEKDEVNQQAVQNYFQLIDEAEAFYNAQIRQVVEQMGGRTGPRDGHLPVRAVRFGQDHHSAHPGKALYQQRQEGNGYLAGRFLYGYRADTLKS